MPNGQPNQLANLRPPWQPGTQPKPSTNYVERMISRGHKAAPQAMRLITQAMHDRELPMSLRLRCAEYIVDKTWPKPPAGALAGVLGQGGVEFLELRFVAPGQAKDIPSLEAQAISSTYSEDAEISHASPHTDVEQEDDASC